MICPECRGKITSKNYDADYEWYECPSCGGAVTADEILKAEMERSPAIKAKGKIRRTEYELDKAVEENAPIVKKSTIKQETKLGVSSKESVKIITDTVEEVYQYFGQKIDHENAKDKALNIYRAMVYEGRGAAVREKEYEIPTCKEHVQ